jgi:NTE family protein
MAQMLLADQADRVVLILDAHTARRRPGPDTDRLLGCTAVLLDPAGNPAVSELLDSLAPRTTHRVRGGDDVRRLARRLAGRAVGLVLSGGGARAFAHLGVIAELEAAGITIDRIGGTSMGAFIGALLAQGMDVDEIEACCYREFVRNNPIGDYCLPCRSLIRGSRATAMLHRNLEGLIEDLPRSFFCVTTDIISAQLVVHRRRELATAVGASIAFRASPTGRDRGRPAHGRCTAMGKSVISRFSTAPRCDDTVTSERWSDVDARAVTL